MKRSRHNINTGRLIKSITLKKRTTMADLGKAIDRDASTVASYMKHSSIQTDILLDLCHALHYNFFRDMAAQLPQGFTHSVPENNDPLIQKDQQIAQLQEEIKTLTIENNLMKKALKIE